MGEPSGSQNVASVTEAASSQARTPARPKMVPVPNVTAYYYYYAKDVLLNRGFDVRFVYDYQDGFAPRGVTWATDPAAGTLAPRGSTVTVYATPKDLPLPRRLRASRKAWPSGTRVSSQRSAFSFLFWLKVDRSSCIRIHPLCTTL